VQPTDFTKDCPGRLVEIPGDGWAFVPHPAPRRIDLDAATLRALATAERALGQLTGTLRAAGRHVNPHLISAPLLRREAISSSRIEGTIATPEDLVLLEVEAVEDPSTSIGVAGDVMQVTPAAAAANLRKLVEAEILVEVTGRRRDQRFVAPEILKVAYGEE
jgi:Fic family protein